MIDLKIHNSINQRGQQLSFEKQGHEQLYNAQPKTTENDENSSELANSGVAGSHTVYNQMEGEESKGHFSSFDFQPNLLQHFYPK